MKKNRILIHLLVVFSLFNFCSLASAQHKYEFSTMWGSRGSGLGTPGTIGSEFIEPVDVAVDFSGKVYVVDKRNHRVQKFDENGNFITAWGTFGTQYGQFKYPSGIAVDSVLGFAYVADFRNHRIQKFSLDGTWLDTWGRETLIDGVMRPISGDGNKEFSYPQDVACSSTTGNVYAIDQIEVGFGGLVARIQLFSPDGVYKQTYEYGRALTYGPNFTSLAVSESTGNVYALEEVRETIKIFDKELATDLGGWGGRRTTDDESLLVPRGLAVDIHDNIYTVERSAGNFKKFTSDGIFLSKKGQSGVHPGWFRSPEGIAVNRSGNIVYVCDTFNHRIQKFVRITPGLSRPESLSAPEIRSVTTTLPIPKEPRIIFPVPVE